MGITIEAGVFFGACVRRRTDIGARLDKYIDDYGGTLAAAAVNLRMCGPYLKSDAPEGSATVSARVDCPYGVPGDRLWVRETWRAWDETCATRGRDDEEHASCSEHCRQRYVAYAATPRVGYRPVPDRARITYLDESTPLESNPRLLGPWEPSIHMLRTDSRITLEIVSVRAERLQDITEEDAKAEGARPFFETFACFGRDQRITSGEYAADAEHRPGFAVLWDEINGDRALWIANPWVWRVEFWRVTT